MRGQQVDRFENCLAAPFFAGPFVYFGNNPGQGGSRNELHAQEPQIAFPFERFAKDLNDVIVLELRQRTGLTAAIGSDFQSYFAIRG